MNENKTQTKTQTKNQTKNQTVLISGGSVAGPALAYWLHRHGFTPHHRRAGTAAARRRLRGRLPR
ncbi:hypothetical protein ACFQFR_35840 [Streptomyces goshikiensis]